MSEINQEMFTFQEESLDKSEMSPTELRLDNKIEDLKERLSQFYSVINSDIEQKFMARDSDQQGTVVSLVNSIDLLQQTLAACMLRFEHLDKILFEDHKEEYEQYINGFKADAEKMVAEHNNAKRELYKKKVEEYQKSQQVNV